MSTNVGSVVKFFPSAQNGFTTTLSAGISSGAAIVPLNSVTGYSNGDVAVMIVEPTSATAKQTFTGTVDTAGIRLTGVVWTAGTNQSHLIGATVVDYESATHFSMISKGILQQHNQDGTHSTVTATSVATTGSVTAGSGLAMTAGAFNPNGTWDGWIGVTGSWAFASSTTITVPSNATTTYDVGDFIKITQSAAIKYFVVTAVTATVLTVSGLNGVTVANSAITLPGYSKVRNPFGVGSLDGAGLPYNPYKFSAYRTAAWTSGNGVYAKVAFDTKLYDTGSNFDSVTNNRFVAPVAGFYQFNTTVGSNNNAAQEAIALFKNGGIIKQGPVGYGSVGAGTSYKSMSAVLQLAAADYIEVFYQCAGGAGGIGASQTYFDGYLVSIL